MDGKVYTISQAAKQVGESTSVLRYWEEVLEIRINRNAKGYRCYTGYDIQLFLNIKELKKRGLKLDAIREIIPRIYKYGPGAPRSKTRLLEEPGPDQEREELEEITEISKVIEADEVIELPCTEVVCEAQIVQETEEIPEEIQRIQEQEIQEVRETGESQQVREREIREVQEIQETEEIQRIQKREVQGRTEVKEVKKVREKRESPKRRETSERREVQEPREPQAVQEAEGSSERVSLDQIPLDIDPAGDLRITEFQNILEKLIAQGVKEKNQEELRIRRLDEKIRFHQQSLKQVAAAQEMKQRRGRGRRRKK